MKCRICGSKIDDRNGICAYCGMPHVKIDTAEIIPAEDSPAIMLHVQINTANELIERVSQEYLDGYIAEITRQIGRMIMEKAVNFMKTSFRLRPETNVIETHAQICIVPAMISEEIPTAETLKRWRENHEKNGQNDE